MKDDDLFWFISDFFEQFPPGHQLTIVAKHAFNREYAVNFGPASGGPTEAYHVYAGEGNGKRKEKGRMVVHRRRRACGGVRHKTRRELQSRDHAKQRTLQSHS